MGTSNNPKLCVTLHRQNAHLLHVNSAFASVASLDFGIIRNLIMTKEIILNFQLKKLWTPTILQIATLASTLKIYH